ncbi:hypothetical protein MP638_002708 [Amoeboaphelidium occidentale]|nr:hypothetical protein MP638_002708 [Amoeboaphelidium occidentale]
MNNLGLPVEIIREIAHKLYFDELLVFQASSGLLYELTSDVSFYARYFTMRNRRRSIELVHFYRKQIPNWKDVVKRLYDDIDESTHFFYRNAHNELYYPVMYAPRTTGCEYERLGFEMGRVRFKISRKLRRSRFENTLEDVQELITKKTKNYPELVRSERWHYFEDVLYSDFENYLQHDNYKIKNLDDVEFWFEMLDFAVSKSYASFQQAILKYIIIGIMLNIANGAIDYDKEIIGKRRSNCEKFFADFVERHVTSLASIVVRRESAKRLMDIFKNCLKWRFVILDGWWREENYCSRLQQVCLVDETIRDIFYNKGFYLDYDFLKDVVEIMNTGCSVNFRKACERCLHSSEHVTEVDELVIAAREACQKRAELQSGKYS